MRKLVGHVSVDSGQVIIVDPCYLRSWKNGEFSGEQDESGNYKPAEDGNHYDEACRVTLTKAGAGECFQGLAVASRSGYGDGGYPVYAEYKDGRPVRLTIDFDPPEEDEEEEEEQFGPGDPMEYGDGSPEW